MSDQPSMIPEVRISLDYDDFEALVNGREVVKNGARIILNDIGFPMMWEAIDKAVNAAHTLDHLAHDCAG